MNYLNQRIQYLQRDREKKIMDALLAAGADLQKETDIKVQPGKPGWEDLVLKGKTILSWTTEPQIINQEIDFEYEFYS